MLLSLGTPPPVTARFAVSVVQAAGIVGSAGRLASPAPHPLPALELRLAELVEAAEPDEAVEAAEPLEVEPPLDACELDAPTLLDVVDGRFDPLVLVAPGWLLPTLAVLESLTSFVAAGPAPPPHAPAASAYAAISEDAAHIRRWRSM
jgi:hypothetical protein